MKNKKIYLLRHGETEYNRLGMVQGSGIDAPLNETGVRQASAFFDAYKEISFDKVYITPLIRTRQTVKGFLDLSIPVEVVEGLREISWGDQEGVPFTEESGRVYKETVKRWSGGELDLKIATGESPKEVMNRQKPAIEYILSKEDEETILICTHGRAMRILLCWVMEKSLTEMEQFGHSNCGVYILNYDGASFSIEQSNETTHLNGIEMIR
ncbi:MAG: histidine phosphatase family protein [Cyclobacteriaceae bacterium]